MPTLPTMDAMPAASLPPEAEPVRVPPHRRRFIIGLAIALAVGTLLGALVIASALAAEREARDQRLALLTVRALADLVDRAETAGGGGAEAAAAPGGGINAELGNPAAPSGQAGPAEPAGVEGAPAPALAGGAAAEEPGARVRRVVARFAAGRPEIREIRVITLDGIELTASTAPADHGDSAAPRHLSRDEKPLYDQAQRLRAGVAGNREGAAGKSVRAEEIAAASRPPQSGGGLVLAAPVERGGEVIGMVEIQTAPRAAGHRGAATVWLPLAGAALGAWVLFLLLARALDDRRALLATAAALLLLLAIGGVYRLLAGAALADERRQTAAELASAVAAEASRARALLVELRLPASPPLDPAAWDGDLYRQPHRLLAPGGGADPRQLAGQLGALLHQLNRAVALVLAAALALLAFVGLGGAARTRAALIAHRQAYVYTLPALLAMLVLVFGPFLYGVVLSFTNANIYNTNKPLGEIWVGVQNFADILSDFSIAKRTPSGLVWNYANFYWTLGFTVVWTIANVTIGVTLGLLLALALNTRGLAFRAAYRVLLILPWAMPTYITALVWQGMFHPQFGVINQMLQLCGLRPVSWFDHPGTSFAAVLTTNGWLSFSFMMVITLGALQSIPGDLYEAARVDGASRWRQFRSITLPSLKPALVPAIIISVIWTFNQFNVIYLVSAGQPSGATEILITQAYKLAFEQYRYGYAAAYSVVIFVILLVYGTWQNRVTQATEGI